MKKIQPTQMVFLFLLAAYAVYAALFIQKTSFVVDGERYYMLFDDAMISMRYARNLADGFGLVWNPGGERVEGFTNPLWVVFMSLFHLLPFSITKISLPIQISGAVFLIGSLYFVKKTAEEISGSAFVGLLAVFLSAFYVQLSTWSLLGMEVSLLLLIIAAAVWMAVRMLQHGVFSPWLYVLLGIATLVRFDMAVPYLAILGFLFLFDAPNRRRHLLVGSLLFAAFMGGQTLWRLWYYGDILPNTYYLKMVGAPALLRIARGLLVYFKVAWNLNLILFLLPFAVLLICRDRRTLLLAAVFAAMSVYSIYVGGDAWEHRGGANRFVSVVMPLYFILLAHALELVRRALVSYFQQLSPLANRGSYTAVVVFAVIGLFQFNSLIDANSLKEWLLFERHGFVPGSERYVLISQVLNEITTPEATVGIVTAGIIPYLTDRPSLDMMGKCDARIAREPMRIPPDMKLIDFRPGHMKWNYAYSIRELRPDVVAQLWDGYENPENLQYLNNYIRADIEGFPFFFRVNSPYVDWEMVESRAAQ